MKRKSWLLLILVLTALIVSGVAWQRYSRPPPPPPGLSEAPVPEVEALDWETLRNGVEQMEAPEVRQHGIRLFQAGDPDKAFLLFKTAARKGDGWSAVAVGEMYDPATFSAPDFDGKKTAFSKPNPRKALEWYDLALARGEGQAGPLRDRLIAHLEQAASGGDTKARRLLQKLNQ